MGFLVGGYQRGRPPPLGSKPFRAYQKAKRRHGLKQLFIFNTKNPLLFESREQRV
jgi:hypothetical protein